MKLLDTTVILPAYNEESAIGAVIDEVRQLTPQVTVLVGDNNCTDHTAEVARRKRCTVISVTQQGKGATVRELIKNAATRYVIMADADATYPVGYCVAYFSLLLEHTDVVIGYRRWREGGAMSPLNVFGNTCLSALASSLYLRPVRDLCSGLWGLRTSVLSEIGVTTCGFALEAEMFALLTKRRCRIEQVPIPYRARFSGSSAKLKISDGIRIALCLIKNRVKGG